MWFVVLTNVVDPQEIFAELSQFQSFGGDRAFFEICLGFGEERERILHALDQVFSIVSYLARVHQTPLEES